MDSMRGMHRVHVPKGSGSLGGSPTGGPKFIAVIIGEPIVSGCTDRMGYPLSPVAPSEDVPYALLPVCNTPLIDYILENLVENGVGEVTVMLSSRSMPKVHEHLSQNRTARGKPWLSSDAITVTVVEALREFPKLADAVAEIRSRNIVPQSGSFLFVPIDCVSFFSNLRACYQAHLERVRTVGSYAATVLCTPARECLDGALHNVLVRQLAEREGGVGGGESSGRHSEEDGHSGGGSSTGVGERGSGGLSTGGAGGGSVGVASARSSHPDASPPPSGRDPAGAVATGTGVRLAAYTKGRRYAVPPQPIEHHTMFVMDRATHVVTHMLRQELGEEAPEPPMIAFNSKKRLSVRMDLAPTGFFFICCEALALIDFHIRDLWDFLTTSLLGQVEIYGNVFGVLEVPRTRAVIRPITGLDSYIQANIDVCARRLFPLTRESSFAESAAKYAVSSSCGTAYFHTSARVHGTQHTIGPNVVIGENVSVPATARLTGVVVGSNVQLGEHTSMTSCVVLDGAVIGRNCTLRGSVVGRNVVIGDNTDVCGCLIGAGCIVGGPASTGLESTTAPHGSGHFSNPNSCGGGAVGSASGGTSAIGNGGLVLHNQALVYTAPVGGDGEALRRSSDAASTPEDASEEDGASGQGGRAAGGHQGGAARTPAESSTSPSDTDHWLVGPEGLGRGLVERYVSPVAGTATLFTEDPVPGKAAVGTSDSDGATGSSAEDDAGELFRRAVRRHVEAALLHPARMEACCYDMSTACLSHQMGYPELCEVVTEMLMEHIVSRHGAKGADACVEAAQTLFGQWCRSFYDGFLSRNGTQLIEAMVATLEGMAAVIGAPGSVLYTRGAEIMEVLYQSCDDDLYDERGYCIVSAQGMLAFDAAMARRRQNLERYAGYGKVKKKAAAAAASSSSDSDSSGDSSSSSSSSASSSDSSRDVVEEAKVAVAAMCHPYIISIKDFLEENGEL